MFNQPSILVVLRCGDQSLHPNWVNANANFDVVLSYFGDHISYDLTHIKFVHHFKGSKWQGLYDFFLNHQEVWKDYDYIWLPDDDLNTTVDNLNQFFALCQQYQFDLVQPALTVDSYYSHAMLLKIQGSIYRETNFVEIMMPCFSQKAFQLCWQSFQENKSGWGLEFLWYAILAQHQYKMGIMDITPVHHTRPVGSVGHGLADGQVNQDNPFVEYQRLLEKYQLHIRKGCLSILTVEHRYITDKIEILRQCVYGADIKRLANAEQYHILYREIMLPYQTYDN